MESNLTYHDMSIYSAERIAQSASTFVHTELERLTNYEEKSVHIILYLTDFNPHSTHRIVVDIATTNLHSEKRAPSLMEENEMCTICMEKIVTESNSFPGRLSKHKKMNKLDPDNIDPNCGYLKKH
ncbi:unnamed protein product [Eruca vesicaria subsp. sativa]|uniref:Uncharacterized protein n=1 Tax=Eruca vesicaria subsp. sativa TaxID=29727 RepID=A0ABC8K0F1_ERUVS|nr:unnamed protein product [Eruca vesicaria subsp. sativa]